MGTSSTGCCTTCSAFLPKCLQPLCQAGGDMEGLFCVGIKHLCPHPCVRFTAQQWQDAGIVALQCVQVIEVGYLGLIFILEYIFRAHLKWKDMRRADMVSVGVWCCGKGPCHVGSWHNMHQICTCFHKMKLLVNM